MNWLLPVGLGVVAAAVVLAATKKEDKSTVRFNPGDLTGVKQGFNGNPLVRYTGAFQPITYKPPASHPGQF